MTAKEINYTIRISSIFAIGVFVIVLMFSQKDAAYVTNNIPMVLALFLALLTFPYFILKLFFYINSHHNKNNELKLEELPKDQDDIEQSH